MDNTGVPETVFVSVGDRQWYLTAVPENTILDATQDTAFFTMMTAAGFCTFLSMAAAFLISRGLTHNIKYLKESFNRFLIISLDVLICRYSPLLRAFPALFISEEPHKSFYYPLCFRSQK